MESPFFTCIVLSHDKPQYVIEAIESLARQTFQNWEAILFDSGALFDQGFFESIPELQDPRIRLIRSWETEELRQTKTIASWCFNECFRQGYVNGRYITYLCDDDLLYPNAFQAFHDYLMQHPDQMAIYASVDMTVENRFGENYHMSEILAEEVRGRCCQGGPLDCHIDYLQLCHHIDVLKSFPTDEYWSEDRAVMDHADGVFLEDIGEHYPIYPLNVKIGENRKVAASLNYGGGRVAQLVNEYRQEELEEQYQSLGLLGKLVLASGIPQKYRTLQSWWRRGKRRAA